MACEICSSTENLTGYEMSNGQWVCIETVQNGHIDCLRDVIVAGIQPHVNAGITLARNEKLETHERLEMLKLLHDAGCPWDSTIVSCAASRGYFEFVKYAIENGCPVSSDAIRHATMHDHPHIVDLIYLSGVKLE